MKRRDFLRLGAFGGAAVLSGATGLVSWSPRANAATVTINLLAMAGNVTQVDGVSTYMFSFSATGAMENPGSTIVCQSGDTVTINVRNTLTTNVALNVGGTGKRVVVAPGSIGTLTFTAPAAGTYLYYDDLNGGVNRVMGLHGAFIVMPAGEKHKSFTGAPSFVRQYKWVLGNVDPNWCNQVATRGDNYVASGALTVNNFVPKYFTINGSSYPDTHNPNSEIAGMFGEAALIRILNAGMATHSPHFHANHVDVISVNRVNYTSPKTKDIVSMFPLDCRDVVFPMKRPPDAYPPIAEQVQHFPMHCHAEMSQTAGGGFYPHGMHASIVMNEHPHQEPDLTIAVEKL